MLTPSLSKPGAVGTAIAQKLSKPLTLLGPIERPSAGSAKGFKLRRRWNTPGTGEKKRLHEAGVFYKVGWLMGLEPTTTRITIWDSTN